MTPKSCIHTENFLTTWKYTWRRTEISLIDSVKNEVLQRVKMEGNVLHTINRRKGNWSCLVQRTDCLLKYVMEGKIEEKTERAGR